MKVRAALVVVLLLLGVGSGCGDSDQRKSNRDGSESGAGGAGGDEEVASASGRDSASGGAAGSTEGGAGPQSSIGLDQYCSRIAALYFDFATTCYGATDYPESSRDGFVARMWERCLEAAPSVEAGRLSFDGAQAARCVAQLTELSELSAIDACTPFDLLLRAPQCAALFSGQVEPGQDCYRDATLHYTVIGAASECRGGYCEADQCPGTCHAFLEEGEPCQAGQCGPDSACIDEQCAPRQGEGEACPQEDACETGLTCVGNVCHLPSQPGDTCYGELCSTGYNCIEGECWAKVETGHVCSWRYDCSADERCLDRDGDGPEGLTCGPIGELGEGCSQHVDCAAGSYCERESTQMFGTCESLLPIGAECGAQNCEPGAWCDVFAGRCQASGEAGDDCLHGSMPGPKQSCVGDLLCMNDGKCHPVGDVGEPCHLRQTESCLEGNFCSREGATCAPLAGLGDYCNPFLPQPCQGELGCLCTGDDCATFTPQDDVHDTLFTCAPRRQPTEECFGEFECADGADCTGDLPLTCILPDRCLP